MRYWLLCGKLKVIENRAYGYHIGGTTMGIKTSRFEKIMGDAIRVISDLSNCLEKAEKERDDALELLHSYRHICGETPPERLSELVQADREGHVHIGRCLECKHYEGLAECEYLGGCGGSDWICGWFEPKKSSLKERKVNPKSIEVNAEVN